MTISILLIITTVVAATGALSGHLFRSADSPHLLTIRGSLAHVILGGLALWTAAVGAGLVALAAVSLVTPGIVALAIFFGVEAVALDICAHRVRYVRDGRATRPLAPVPQTVSVRRPF